jgi:hypothetical protein
VLCMRQLHSASATLAVGRGVPTATPSRGHQGDVGCGGARRRRAAARRGRQVGWGPKPKDQVGDPTRMERAGVTIRWWLQRWS